MGGLRLPWLERRGWNAGSRLPCPTDPGRTRAMTSRDTRPPVGDFRAGEPWRALRIVGEFVTAPGELSELELAISRRTAIRRPGRGAPGVESPASRKGDPECSTAPLPHGGGGCAAGLPGSGDLVRRLLAPRPRRPHRERPDAGRPPARGSAPGPPALPGREPLAQLRAPAARRGHRQRHALHDGAARPGLAARLGGRTSSRFPAPSVPAGWRRTWGPWTWRSTPTMSAASPRRCPPGLRRGHATPRP